MATTGTTGLPSSAKDGDQELLKREVARGCAERANGYDRAARFPVEDFDDLFTAGLLAPTVPREHGGLGLGPLHGDTATLWLMTTELAKADLSLARCWEAHANSLLLIDALGGPEQKVRWFKGVVQRGDKWAAWSGEPQAAKPGQAPRFGTHLTRTENGWLLNGSKAFATGASGAQRAILLVDTAGPGDSASRGHVAHPSLSIGSGMEASSSQASCVAVAGRSVPRPT